MTSVESALRKATADLNAIGARWALVGGLAVSVRTVPRFTRDLDFARSASLAEVAAALAALTGEPHPLAAAEEW